MGNTKLSLLITLLSCMDMKKSPYTKVSVLKIIELLEKIHKIKIQRRWVFQCLRDLIDDGLITRRARYKRVSDNTIRQLSSIVVFSLKGAKLLVSKKISGGSLLFKNILAWLKNKDNRFPTYPDLIVIDKKEIDTGETRRLKALASKVYKPILV